MPGPYVNVHRMARISPTKVRPVVDQIRGKKVGDAMAVLELSSRRGAALVLRCLDAAVGNAQNKDELSNAETQRLVVADVRVDSGPTIKRWQPKDRGRAHPILKRTSHITLALDLPK